MNDGNQKVFHTLLNACRMTKFFFLLGGELVENLFQGGLRDGVILNKQFLFTRLDRAKHLPEAATRGLITEGGNFNTHLGELTLAQDKSAKGFHQKRHQIIETLFQNPPS